MPTIHGRCCMIKKNTQPLDSYCCPLNSAWLPINLLKIPLSVGWGVVPGITAWSYYWKALNEYVNFSGFIFAEMNWTWQWLIMGIPVGKFEGNIAELLKTKSSHVSWNYLKDIALSQYVPEYVLKSKHKFQKHLTDDNKRLCYCQLA